MIEKIDAEKLGAEIYAAENEIRNIMLKSKLNILSDNEILTCTVIGAFCVKFNALIDEINVLYEKVEKLSKAKQENDGR